MQPRQPSIMATRGDNPSSSPRTNSNAHASEPQRNSDCRFPCNVCGRSFKRLEHLGRHRQGHQEVKRFSCPVCSKRFARSDILLRHKLIHLAAPSTDAGESTNGDQDDSRASGSSPRRKRACVACAKAHEGCSKGEPCQRCVMRSTECIYTEGRSASAKQTRTNKPIQARPPSDSIPETPAEEEVTDANMMPYTTQAPYSHGATSDVPLVPDDGMGQMFPERPAEATANEATFEDNTAQAVSMLLDMQTAGDNTLLMQTNDYGVSGGANFLTDRSNIAIPQPMAESTANTNSVYNAWNTPYLPADGPTLNFSMNWLPENLNTDLDYVSILGQSLSLVTADLEPQAQAYSQMQPSVTAVQAGLTPSLGLNNTMPLVMQDAGNTNNIGRPGLSNSPATSSSPEETPSPSRSLRNGLPSGRLARGNLYTTSINGARVPCTVRDKQEYVPIPGTKHLLPINSKGVLLGTASTGAPLAKLPSLSHISVAQLLPQQAGAQNTSIRIWPSTYENIRQGIRQTYIASGEAGLLDETAIPSLDHLNFFTHLYFQKCNPVLPILHEHFAPLNDSWLLALAVSTVGAQYTCTEEFTSLAGVLHEVLHRTLMIELETTDSGTGGNMAVIQALFLSQIGLLYHGPPRLFRRAKSNHHILVDLLRCSMLLDASRENMPSSNFASVEQEWSQWVHDEVRRRLGYAIWLLDCMMVFQMGNRALLSLSDAQASMPHDGLWSAPTAEKWHNLMKQSQANPNLPSATQQLFVDKLVKPDLGEFSRIILLHGVYQEIWQVKRYFDRPLSNWMLSAPTLPNDDLPECESTASSSAMDVASDRHKGTGASEGPSYSSWRNAACDCVDVLHWAANGMIAQLSGSEHTTVFHLHFARVVLLTPFDDIQTLARYLASLGDARPERSDLGPTPTRTQGLAAERAIIAWAQQDEHKARLAVLHCGCFLWHIRRYSAMAFYEPIAVYMACLSIWAYSSYASQSKPTDQAPAGQDKSRHASPSGEEYGGDSDSRWHQNTLPDETDERFPSFVHLDRPNDDEMVQLFVRSGRPSVMRAYISGIGNICSPKAPVRILKEGVKILTNVSMVWGRTDRYVNVLTALTSALLKLETSDT